MSLSVEGVLGALSTLLGVAILPFYYVVADSHPVLGWVGMVAAVLLVILSVVWFWKAKTNPSLLWP